ncbi:MAG: methytransferase partner Trm112 [Dehalococcoidales bacterium]
MNPELLNIIVCPLCKNKLKLSPEEQTEKEVTIGFLFCADCDINYPIANGIPNLLPPQAND